LSSEVTVRDFATPAMRFRSWFPDEFEASFVTSAERGRSVPRLSGRFQEGRKLGNQESRNRVFVLESHATVAESRTAIQPSIFFPGAPEPGEPPGVVRCLPQINLQFSICNFQFTIPSVNWVACRWSACP